jgi:hypothetical protein
MATSGIEHRKKALLVDLEQAVTLLFRDHTNFTPVPQRQ